MYPDLWCGARSLFCLFPMYRNLRERSLLCPIQSLKRLYPRHLFPFRLLRLKNRLYRMCFQLPMPERELPPKWLLCLLWCFR